MYLFNPQLEIGEEGERRVETFFSQFYTISSVPMDLQRLGVDRIFVSKIGSRFTVEIKTDLTAVKTGNLFFETEAGNKAGWGWSSVSQLILYYVPPYVYVLDTIALRMAVQHEKLGGRESPPIPNKGYTAKGLLIPLSHLKYPVLVAKEVIDGSSSNSSS